MYCSKPSSFAFNSTDILSGTRFCLRLKLASLYEVVSIKISFAFNSMRWCSHRASGSQVRYERSNCDWYNETNEMRASTRSVRIMTCFPKANVDCVQ